MPSRFPKGIGETGNSFVGDGYRGLHNGCFYGRLYILFRVVLMRCGAFSFCGSFSYGRLRFGRIRSSNDRRRFSFNGFTSGHIS